MEEKIKILEFNPPIPLPKPRKPLSQVPLFPARYRCDGEIGKGGIGSVWRVHDRQMNRSLAAKVLLPNFKNHRAANERLVREALLAGSIQHPGIPPVYEHGALLAGSSFFTMKLVEGKTLDELLAERTDPSQNRQHFLNVFRQIAEAVGFAHSKQVLHRDLKPQNIMVGEFGEVQIMDWGMAKRLGVDTHDLACQAEKATLVDQAETDTNMQATDSSLDGRSLERNAALTAQGEVFGTPFYMSPEQAAGDLANMDQRSDVFSLGAILFEILVGRRLYEGVTEMEPVRIAAEADLTEALADLESAGLDEDLVAICQHCLALNFQQRPPHGGAVALRIGRHLESVEQRLQQAEVDRTSAEVRAGEEKKRRKTFVRMAIAVGLVSLLGILGFAWAWSQSNKNLREANRQNEVRQIYFSKSLEAIDKMLTRVGFETLENIPGMGELRRELLVEALGFYEEFVQMAGQSSRLDIELAKVHIRVAKTHWLLGEKIVAADSYATALEILKGLRRDDPDDEQVALVAASCEALLSDLQIQVGKPESAANHIQAALLNFELGIERFGISPLWNIELAEATQINAALLRFTVGIDRSIEEMKLADQTYRKIPPKFADNRVRVGHANCLNLLARSLREADRPDQAEQMINEAIAILEDVVQDSPDSPAFRNQLVNLLQEQNSVLANRGQVSEAAEGFSRQLKLQMKLARDFPSVFNLRQSLVHTFALHGAALDSMGQTDQAIAAYDEGIDIGEDLLESSAESIGALRELSYIYKNSAIARSRLRDPEQVTISGQHFLRSYNLLNDILAVVPKDPDNRYDLATLTQAYAFYLVKAENEDPNTAFERASQLFVQSENLLVDLLDENPKDTRYRFRLATTRSIRAQNATDVGPQQAASLLQLAAEDYGSLIAADPDHPVYRYHLAGTYDRQATFHMRLNEKAEWESALRKALQTMEQAADHFGENGRIGTYLAVAKNKLAHCIKTTGKQGEADQLFLNALAVRQQQAKDNPQDTRIPQQLASSYSNLAWMAFWFPEDQRDLDQSIGYAVKATELDPEVSDHWTVLAFLHFLNDDQASFQATLRQGPPVDNFERMVRSAMRALQLTKTDQIEEAEAQLAIANELFDDPNISNDWASLSTYPEGYELVEMARQAISSAK